MGEYLITVVSMLTEVFKRVDLEEEELRNEKIKETRHAGNIYIYKIKMVNPAKIIFIVRFKLVQKLMFTRNT